MRRRVLAATLAAVTLSVLLLGVPLALAGVVLTGAQAQRSATERAEAVAGAVERREAAGEPVTPAVLAPFADAAGAPPAHVRVRTADGGAVEAGRPAGGGAVTGTASTPDGLVAQVAVPRSAVLLADAQLVVLVLGLAAGAVAGGWALALVQARRLARPVEDLGRSAEALGAGRVPAPTEPTGVEEVDKVARALADSAARVASRLEAERRFASDASHQLRTPLTALSMRLEEIEAAGSAQGSAAVVEEARAGLEQVERLVAVVDDLLARARAAPATSPVPLDLGDVLAQQRREWEPAFTRASRALRVAAPPTGPRVLAGAGPLAQALATLLENSLVHGGGTTTVAVTASGRGGGHWVVVEVADEGPGVPAALAPRIFEPRVSGAARTGLGLPLARDLVVAEGGRLELLRAQPATFALFLRAA